MYIAIDVGGTNMRIALVNLSGKESIIKLESHRVSQNYQKGIEALCGHIVALSDGEKIEGIGACFPGIIDKNDMVTTANNLPDWAMKPIKQTLEARFHIPVKLVHDVQGAAIGEALFGAAKGRDRFVYFILHITDICPLLHPILDGLTGYFCVCQGSIMRLQIFPFQID